MREAIGGTWLFGIVILFIALFASFLAYSISYTRAFNTKNEIINLIERNEGYTTCDDGMTSTDEIVNNSGSGSCDVLNMSDEQLLENPSVQAQAMYKIRKAGYNYSATQNIECDERVGHKSKEKRMQDGGYCITKYCPTDSTGHMNSKYSVYYKVTTFIAFKIPVIDITVNLPITGETRTMYYDAGKYACDEEAGRG